MVKDTQARKYQLTINNPLEWHLSHDEIKATLQAFKSIKYFCMADEIGVNEHTPHTHVYIVFSSAVRFSTMKKAFPAAHIEKCLGSSEENRAYIRKDGKWALSAKAETVVAGTFEEWGEMPQERQGRRHDLLELYDQIKAGASDIEILESNPKAMLYLDRIQRVRQTFVADKYANAFRQLETTYVWGPTGTGKTRGVMKKHGYGNVYRVTDYSHPFDRYAQEPVLCLDEFRSSLQIGDVLDYLDGYPLALPARYANRQACYETVYLISNIDLTEQYRNVQVIEPETWKAFLRRIDHVIEYRKDGPPIDHGNATDYIFPPPPPVPDWVTEAEQAEQIAIPF